MKLKDLQNLVEYALEQAASGCCILDSDKGYDTAEYEQEQKERLDAIKQELDAVRKLYDEGAESKTWSDEVHIIK